MVQQKPISTTQSEDVTPVARQVFLDTLLEREREGIETYGVSLQTHNGRDAVQDAAEEAVDLWQYLIQVKMERADLERQLEEAIESYTAQAYETYKVRRWADAWKRAAKRQRAGRRSMTKLARRGMRIRDKRFQHLAKELAAARERIAELEEFKGVALILEPTLPDDIAYYHGPPR